MLRLDHVAMRYREGPEVLHDLDLTLGPGEMVFVTGANGAGKTSLLRLLALLHRPSAGRIFLFDEDVTGVGADRAVELRRRIGVVFQDGRLLDHLSVFDNAALPLRITGAREDQVGAFVSEMLASVGLGGVIDAKPPTLSMGQRQLVNVVRAVVTRPALLLCDEPTANLDGKVARRLVRLFIQMAQLGTTVVVTTQSADLVRRGGRPVLHLAGGRLGAPAAAAA
jgi:cell division transport system ATP-binding protein